MNLAKSITLDYNQGKGNNESTSNQTNNGIKV